MSLFVLRALLWTFISDDLAGMIGLPRSGGENGEAVRSRLALDDGAYGTVSLRTKKIKGLHENDFIMAAKIDRLAAA